MFSCEICRSQMLEYLYDLLEGDERQAWEAHVKDCPSCQAALVQAKGQQKLLAAAAKMEFANVHFTAPPSPLFGGGAGLRPPRCC
jgi:anti-sigma factor RsiW